MFLSTYGSVRVLLSLIPISLFVNGTLAFAQTEARNRVMASIPGITIAADLCPIEKMTAKTQDQRTIRAYYRQPPGDGPFPAVVCIHGGIGSTTDKVLRSLLMNNVVYTRFLAAGFVTVAADYRNYRQTPKARGPILDCLAIVEQMKTLPSVDGESVFVYGGSGGGSIALEIAGLSPLPAVVCGEPATMLFCGMLEDGEFDKREEVWENPREYYTAERKALTQKKIKQITCPVLILHSNQHALNKLNTEIFIPEMKAAGKDVEYKEYPGNPHGFYWGVRTTQGTVDQFMGDVESFVNPKLRTKPKPFEF